MGRSVPLVGAIAVALLLAGCGAGSTPQLRSAGAGTLTVSSTVSPGARGARYTEGALVEVVLRDGSGGAVATKRADSDHRIVFAGLATGSYTVEPALRPCDGTCVNLDPRVDGCRHVVRVSGDRVIAVHFVIGSPCVVEAPPREPSAAGTTDG